MNTPVALCVFNRPDFTEIVFERIAHARPRRLLVFADGPRSIEDEELCRKTRAITERVDWECDASYNFAEVNLGLRTRIESGLDWVFSQVDEAIFLEDDCVPDPTLFPFCEAMLEHYRNDPKVMMVSGANYMERWKDASQSYHFSHFGTIFGWATWKRAWITYDTTMAAWGDDKVRARIRELLGDDEIFEFQSKRFDLIHADPNEQRSWSLPWMVTRLAQGGVAVVPAVNMTANIGNVGGRGIPPDHPLANLEAGPMLFPLRFQDAVVVDREYDYLHYRRIAEYWERGPKAAGGGRLGSGSSHDRPISERVTRTARGLFRRARRELGRLGRRS